MGYLTLLESSGSYVGLGIPLVCRGSSCFLGGLDPTAGPSSAGDWFCVSIAYGARDSDGG